MLINVCIESYASSSPSDILDSGFLALTVAMLNTTFQLIGNQTSPNYQLFPQPPPPPPSHPTKQQTLSTRLWCWAWLQLTSNPVMYCDARFTFDPHILRGMMSARALLCTLNWHNRARKNPGTGKPCKA